MIEVVDNQLIFDGCNTATLARDFGTPLYVMSENIMLSKINELKDCFTLPYPKNRIAYAAKAFLTLAMAKIIQREELYLDVVSGGELHTAIKANFPAEKIEFNGNNKSRSELEMAIDYGIGKIIIDNSFELDLIEDICKTKNKTIAVLFRITPGIKSDTHDYIITGKKDSKFGISMDKEVFMPLVKRAIASKYVDLVGLHFHIGSQILDNSSYLQSLDILLTLVNKVKTELSYDFTVLNIGGGFGVRYTDEKVPPFTYFLTPMMEKIENYYKDKNLELPSVVIEPGRSIVAESGITLYTVGSSKDIQGIRKYISVDGGMGDNIRPALYGAKYRGLIANKADDTCAETVTISGKYCESGDVLIRDIDLPLTKPGDILAIFSTGAYGYSMANNYNKNPIPGVLLVNHGRAEWMVKPQTYEDMIKNEVVPESLAQE